MEGIILWFNEYKGYGEAESNDGDRFFFMKEDSELKPLKLKSGTLITFNVSRSLLFGWPRATNVTAKSKKSNVSPSKRSDKSV